MAIASVICLFDMPYGYFELYRYVALGIFIFLALKSQNDSGWFLTWLISAMLVQPFMKISFGKEIWNLVNVSWTLLLLFSSISREDYIIKIQQSIRRFFIHPAVMLIFGFIWIFGTRFIAQKYDELIDHAYDKDHFYISSSQNGDIKFSCNCEPENTMDFDSIEEAKEFRESLQEASLSTIEYLPIINKFDNEIYGSAISVLIMLIALAGNVICVWVFVTHRSFKK